MLTEKRNRIENRSTINSLCELFLFSMLSLLLFAGNNRGNENLDVKVLRELSFSDISIVGPGLVVKSASGILSQNSTLSSEKIRLLSVRAYAYLFLKDYISAEQDWNSVLELNPDLIDALRMRSYAKGERGLTKQAMNELNGILKRKPKDSLTFLTLAGVYFNNKQWDASIENATKAIGINPELAEAYFIRGASYVWKKEFDKSLQDLNKSILFDPFPTRRGKPENPYLVRGFTLLSLGKTTKAFRDFLLAHRLNPSSFFCNLCLWRTYQIFEKTHLALKFAKKMTKLNPNDVQGYIACSASFLAVGESDKAIVAGKKAVELDSKNSQAYYRLGNAYAKIGKFDAALKTYDSCLAIQSDFYEALYSKGTILAGCPIEKNRNGKLAVDIARKLCMKTNWKNPIYLLLLAEAQAECGNYKEAIKFAKQSLLLFEPTMKIKIENLIIDFQKGKPWRFAFFPVMSEKTVFD